MGNNNEAASNHGVMTMKYGRTTLAVLLMLSILLCILTGCSKEGVAQPGSYDYSGLELTEYDPEDAIEQALSLLQTEEKESTAIFAVEAKQRKVAIVFLGLADPGQMEQLCDILDDFKVPALFAVDGMSAAEDPESVRLLKRLGYEIGNYSLTAERHMERLSEEEIASSFAHAQVILETITGDSPNRFAANAAQMERNLLHAAYCAGLREGVQPNTFLSSTSLPSFNAAMGYVEDITSGSIIGIKLNDSLDEIEFEDFEQDLRPEKHPETTLEEEKKEEVRNTDIVLTVRYLMEALNTTQTAIVSLDRLPIEVDKDVEKMFQQLEDTTQYELPEHDPVETEWFSDSLFIGDSLTLAMSIYDIGMPESTGFCAYKSIVPKQFLDNITVENAEGNQIAVFDEICKYNPSSIFVLLGTNALASGSNASLTAAYEQLLTKLNQQFPEATIYVQGLPPVSKAVSTERITLTNGRIRAVNLELAKMAERSNCRYIDLTHALADEDGNLSTYNAQEDGIHLNDIGCQKWFDYLKSHVEMEEAE